MKKVGIIVDNWKLKTFKRKLEEKDFKFTIKPFTKNTTMIFIETAKDKINIIRKLCIECEIEVKQSN